MAHSLKVGLVSGSVFTMLAVLEVVVMGTTRA
jgi:hypothetical protein